MGTVNLCTESPGFIMSPRISFSHNLYQNDVLQIESPHHQQQQNHQHLRSDDSLLLEPNFDFCISSDSFIQESSSSADELFSDGKLLPLLLKQKLLPSPQQNSQSHYDPPPPAVAAAATVTTLETDSIEPDSSTEPDCKEETITEKSSLSSSSSSSSSSTASSNSKSFWGFKRSSSCGNGYKKSLICSLSILPRSNSTGSAPNLKSKENPKQKLQKSKSAYSSSSSGSSNSSSSSCQKPPLKKNYGGYNSINGGRMNPAHNVPPPYIPGNLFGLGSLFTSNGKDKNRKK
ncbi:hypothetical protein MKW92_046705 [Papaver armeniacum]|nr:hypothetical protein MKW92_046705 [Papaver armeniacum]